MTGNHAFVDESIRDRYIVCGAVVSAAQLDVVRSALAAMRLAGQRRVHMAHEGDARRKFILSAVSALPVRAVMVSVDGRGRSQRAARDAALAAVVPALAEERVERLVVESCDQDKQDRVVIQRCLRATRSDAAIRYLHATAAAEPLLWVPDIITWAYGRKGDWRPRLGAVVVAERRVRL